MRPIIAVILLIIVLPLGAEETAPVLPKNATKALERFEKSTAKLDAALAEAKKEHKQGTEKATANLVSALEKSVARASAVEQASVYRMILTYDRDNASARQFFTAMGTLELTLAAIEEAEAPTDFLGNPIPQLDRLESFLIGTRWMRQNGAIWTFNADGTFHNTGKWGGGTWRLEDNTIYLSFSNGKTYSANIAVGDTAFTTNPDRGNATLIED